MQYLAVAFLVFTILINIFFGLAVLLRMYRKLFGWYFVSTVFGVILWAIGDLGLLFARDASSVHAFALLFYIAPMITPISIWLFALTFPDNKPLPKWAPFLPILPFLAISFVFFADFGFFIKHIAISASGLNIATPQKPGFYLYSAYFSFFFLMAYIAFFRKARQLKGLSRTQERYILYGVLFGSFLALLSNLSLPVSGITGFIWLGPFFSLIFPAAVTVAIVRHQLFNIRLVLARSMGYILTVVSLAIGYGLVTFTLVNQVIVRNSTASFKQQLVYAVVASSLAFTFNPVRRFFERGTNRLFYRDAYDPQAFYNDFNKALVSTIDLDMLLRNTTRTIVTYLKAEYCLVGVKDASPEGQRIIGTAPKSFLKHEIAEVRHITPRIHQTVIVTDDISVEHQSLKELLVRNNIALLVRLSSDVTNNQEGLGYIVLGTKKSGNPYGSQDVKVLEAAANELIIAIQNAMRFEEIEQFNITLQEKIDDATKKLRHTNERLRVLDQTKDDFISMASHQLRTPLTSVKGYVSMVLDGDAGNISGTQRKLLTQSFLSSQRMVYLISDLLNVSRLKTGKFVIEPVPTDLSKVIEEEVDQLHETVKSRELTLTYHKPEHFPILNMDETKIRQVMMNFIDNAVYYTPAKGHIDVYLVDKGQSIEFTVVDDGIGVPKHEQHHLFSKFYRAHNAKRARPDGTGLGIFMAKKVIIAQGGAVIFKSTEGKGSTFGFTFSKAALAKMPAAPHTGK